MSEVSDIAIKNHSFSFVGSTITYASMQVVGIVIDHTVNCFRYPDLGEFSYGESRSISPLKTTKPFAYNTVPAGSGHGDRPYCCLFPL